MANVIDFTFEVGEHEKHRVRYHFNQSLGFGSISVDDVVVKRTFEMFSLSTRKERRLTVGSGETHIVTIEKDRKRVMGGFLPQTCKVFVDGSPINI